MSYSYSDIRDVSASNKKKEDRYWYFHSHRTDVLHEVDVTEKIDDSKMLKTRKIGILKHMVKQADDLIRFLWSLSCISHWLISWSEEW